MILSRTFSNNLRAFQHIRQYYQWSSIFFLEKNICKYWNYTQDIERIDQFNCIFKNLNSIFRYANYYWNSHDTLITKRILCKDCLFSVNKGSEIKRNQFSMDLIIGSASYANLQSRRIKSVRWLIDSIFVVSMVAFFSMSR